MLRHSHTRNKLSPTRCCSGRRPRPARITVRTSSPPPSPSFPAAPPLDVAPLSARAWALLPPCHHCRHRRPPSLERSLPPFLRKACDSVPAPAPLHSSPATHTKLVSLNLGPGQETWAESPVLRRCSSLESGVACERGRGSTVLPRLVGVRVDSDIPVSPTNIRGSSTSCVGGLVGCAEKSLRPGGC